jgi:hypothetical protein
MSKDMGQLIPTQKTQRNATPVSHNQEYQVVVHTLNTPVQRVEIVQF